MSPRRLVELTTSERRRVVSGAIARFVATFAGVIAIYYLLPLSQGVAGPDDVIRILVAAAVFVAIVFWQVRQIMRADLPALRALEAVGFVIPLFLCSYAAIYVLLSLGSPDNFSEPLTRSAALYFAIVVFGTVGFGDIFPIDRSGPPRRQLADPRQFDLHRRCRPGLPRRHQVHSRAQVPLRRQ